MKKRSVRSGVGGNLVEGIAVACPKTPLLGITDRNTRSETIHPAPEDPSRRPVRAPAYGRQGPLVDRLGIPGSSGSVQAGSFCAACHSDFVDGLAGTEGRATGIVGRAQGSSASYLRATEDDRRMGGPWEGRQTVTGVRSARNLVADKAAHREAEPEACWRVGSRVHGSGSREGQDARRQELA